MNLQTAIDQREYHFERYLEAQKKVDALAQRAAEQAEMERMNRELTGREVASFCGVTDRTVYGWPTDAISFIEWAEFLKGYKYGQYYKRFVKNFKRSKG